MEDIPELPPIDHLPQSMKDLRDDRHRRFAWAYIMGNADRSEAAKWAGFSDHLGRCRITAHELLLRDDIQNALRDLGQRYLFNLMPKALVRLSQLLDNPNPMDRGKAVERVLNRVKGFAEQNKLDVEVKVDVTDQTKAALDDLRGMIALGFSRDQLVATFGASGLERYEKMLEGQQSAQGGFLIEHRADEGKP